MPLGEFQLRFDDRTGLYFYFHFWGGLPHVIYFTQPLSHVSCGVLWSSISWHFRHFVLELSKKLNKTLCVFCPLPSLDSMWSSNLFGLFFTCFLFYFFCELPLAR